ncbi:MAG: prenyltransferase/squalene oxidase repeat-containing protein [Gemmataceae bacterium]
MTLFSIPTLHAQTAEQDLNRFPKLTPSRNDEPFAKNDSAEKAGEFLDRAAMGWLRERECASCHTSYPYLMARPMLGNRKVDGFIRMRSYLEERVAGWDRGGKDAGLPKENDEAVTEIVATAATLAFDDAQGSGKLHPRTRQALDRMWSVQREDGSWNWNKHELPPQELDESFGVIYAAWGLGYAPEKYAETEKARAGLKRIQSYLSKNPAPHLHHRVWLLWASLRTPGLMTQAERKQTVDKLITLQRKDGGWCLPSLGKWQRQNGEANDSNAESDGYATGLVLYVLRETGMSAKNEVIQRGVKWLKSNQRESGRWFTRSLSNDHAHYNTNAGTAFAVMALKACKE